MGGGLYIFQLRYELHIVVELVSENADFGDSRIDKLAEVSSAAVVMHIASKQKHQILISLLRGPTNCNQLKVALLVQSVAYPIQN